MNCATCKVNKISPKTAPHGGFLCGNEHLQCGECDRRGAGHCGVCAANTTFVQMNLHRASCMAVPSTAPPAPPSAPTTTSAPQVQARSHAYAPTAPRREPTRTSINTEAKRSEATPSDRGRETSPALPDCHHNVRELASNTSYMFPKSFFADLETQSSISQEHLSMQDSHDRLTSTSHPTAAGRDVVVVADADAHKGDENGNDGSATETGNETVRLDQAADRPNPQLMSMTSPPPQQLVNNKSFTKIQFPSPAMSALERAQMETLFFGSNPPPNSASNFTFSQLRMGLGGGSRPTVSMASAARELDTPEELEDSNVIHTSEIRFMESTESLKNYYSGGTMHPSLKQRAQGQEAAEEQREHQQQTEQQQQELLSAKRLQEFESQNTATPGELVENYLRTYGPLTVCHFPAYSFNHNCYHGGVHEGWNSQQRQALMRSICVSTESEPSLAGNNPGHGTTMNNAMALAATGKFLPPDYFVMTATGVAEPPPGALSCAGGKTQARHSLDLRMQKLLETFQEDPGRAAGLAGGEKPLLEPSKNFIKAAGQQEGAAPTATSQRPTPAQPAKVEPTTNAGASTLVNRAEEQLGQEDIATHLSNSHRAFYNPPSMTAISSSQQQQQQQQQQSQPAITRVSTHSIEPQPQFQIISWSSLAANDLMLAKERYVNMRPMPACQLNIPRSPIQCPESACQRMIFVSDFNKHLVVDHSKLPMERIAPRQCKNFFIDPRLSHVGVSRCHLLYLIRDKITDLGSSKFKDFLPLLVMSSRVKLTELCGDPYAHSAAVDDLDFLMIWLTGIVPEEFPVSVSLTVWPRSGLVPTCHLVHSGEMYSIRKSQLVSDICQSGQMLLLSPRELQLLTNNGKDMLELQVVVH